MNELLKFIDELNLSEKEQAHWEYVISKFLDKHMPFSSLSPEDIRFLKEHGWYQFFIKEYRNIENH